MSPVGNEVVGGRYSAAQLCSLVDTLRIVHQANYVHHDVRPSIVLQLQDIDKDECFLIDWGYAHDQKNEIGSFSGTVGFASISVLEQLTNPKSKFGFNYKAEDDLESILRLYHYAVTGQRADFHSQTSTYAHNSLKFWRKKSQVLLIGLSYIRHLKAVNLKRNMMS